MPQPETSARALRRAGWLLGLLPLAGIWAGTALWSAHRLSARILAAGEGIVSRTAPEHGEPWLRLSLSGRDLIAEGEAPDAGRRAIVLAELGVLEGPRRIVSEIGLVETAAPFQWAATRVGPASVALEGHRPVEIGRRALEVEVTGAIGTGTQVRDAARAARGAPPDFAAAAAFLAARLPGLAPGGRATLTDTVLAVSGEAVDLTAYDSLRTALARPPEGFSVGKVEILPPRIADYRLTLARTGTGVALTGYVPSEAARQAALATATALGDGSPVDDRLQTARGLPEAVDPRALLDLMGRAAALIQSGEVTYSGGAVSIRGDAIDPQAIPRPRPSYGTGARAASPPGRWPSPPVRSRPTGSASAAPPTP